LLEVVPSGLAIAAKDLTQGGLQVGYILLGGRIQRLSNDRLLGTSRQPKGGAQGRVDSHRCCRVRDSLGSCQQANKEHL
jgi:hypothetical protein